MNNPILLIATAVFAVGQTAALATVLPLAQIPGGDRAIEEAAKSGWEAVFLVVMMLSSFALFGYLIRVWVTKTAEREDSMLRQAIEREERLGNRINVLEDFNRNTLLEVIQNNAQVISAVSTQATESCKMLLDLREALLSRPCLIGRDKEKHGA